MIGIWASIFLTLIAVVLFAMDILAMELVAIGIIAAGLLLAVILPEFGIAFPEPEALLTGFASPALITIMALLVVGQALFRTGALTGIVDKLLQSGHGIPRSALIMLALFVAMIVSAFMNNTPVTVVFIPILVGLMRGIMPASRHMMALSFVSVLGGMTTLIGSSTNLLVASTSASINGPVIGFFDFFVPGLMLAGVGAAYCLFILPHILPDREGEEALLRNQGKQYVVRLSITQGHPMEGANAVAGLFPDLRDITIKLVMRSNQRFLPPYDEITLQDGDEVVAAATRERLTEVLAKTGSEENQDMVLAEAVVAPGSRLEGRALGATGFAQRTSCIVLGLQRRARMIRSHPNAMYVEPGDTLLLAGSADAMKELARDPDVLLLADSIGEVPPRQKAPTAMAIFIATVALAAIGILPIVVAACLGALAMVVSGCIQTSQAVRAFDTRVIFIVASSVALGHMLEQTGAAAMIAHGLVYVAEGLPPYMLASLLFMVVAIMTNLLSNNATAVIFTPIALGLASTTEGSATLFLHATIFAANACFATPIAYQTNLLVMAPGHYRFGDFVRGGLPLVLILWLTFSIMAAFMYE